MKEARKLLDSCKENVSLLISRETSTYAYGHNNNLSNNNNNNNNVIANRFLHENGNYINGHQRNNSSITGGSNASGYNQQQQQQQQRWPSSEASPNNNRPKESIYDNNDSIQANNNNSSPLSNNNLPLGQFQHSNHHHRQNSALALIANGRANGLSNQNVYVQGPIRGENGTQQQLPEYTQQGQIFNGTNGHANGVNNHNDAPSIDQVNEQHLQKLPSKLMTSPKEPTTLESPAKLRPLPQRPTLGLPEETKLVPPPLPTQPPPASLGEVRHISFLKEGSVGIRLTGGNEVGIFVTAVQPGSPASLQGLQVGDKILKANGTDMTDFTREEAVLYLLRIQDRIDLDVQNCKEEYEDIVSNQKGDSFYIRVHFNYDSDGKGELSFHVGDVFHVVDTLFNGVVGSWFVYRLGRNNQEIQKGSIPNKSRAESLASEQNIEKRSKKFGTSNGDLNATEGSSRRGNFFKRRRSARRSKSLCKDNWEDVVFGESGSRFPAYERVKLEDFSATRPVVFFGPLADIAREKLLRDYPEKFASPQAIDVTNEETKKASKLANSGIVRLSAIKDIIASGKHALLDITPSAVDRLNYAQFYPIVIFMRAESKSIVKELRLRSSSKITVHRSSRKLFEQSIKLEKLWHHIFTSSISLTSGGDLWYKKLREIIDKQQTQSIWVSEKKPVETIGDDFLFPMISRLSYASSPESDLDISAKTDDEGNNETNDDKIDDEDDGFPQPGTIGARLVKASSDPSLAQPDQAPNESLAPSTSTPSKDKAEKPNKSSPSRQWPLHLLKKELSKALNYADRNKTEKDKQSSNKHNNSHQQQPAISSNNVEHYPLGESSSKPNEPSYPSQPIDSDSPLPPPPPTTLPPESSPSSSNLFKLGPPSINRDSKPTRFRSAHERLFGISNTTSKMSHTMQPTPLANLANILNNNIHHHLNNEQQQQPNYPEDSDYINTSSPIKSNRIDGSYGVNNVENGSNNESDSYNKYNQISAPETRTSTRSLGVNIVPSMPQPFSSLNDYRFPRSITQPTVLPSTKHSSIDRNNLVTAKNEIALPTSTSNNLPVNNLAKAPPSPPPKPVLTNKFHNQSLQYQM